MYKNSKLSAFTLVEMMVAVAIMGILFMITITSYSAVTRNAIGTALQSDLANTSDQFKVYKATYGSFPTTLDNKNCPVLPKADVEYCITPSAGVIIKYNIINVKEFHMTATKDGITYFISSKGTESVNVADKDATCGTGYVWIPGSATYNTSDFCVMKYEAKIDTNGDGIGDTSQSTGYNTWPADAYPISSTRKLVSSAAGYPVANISQNIAIAAASNASYVSGCTTSCHLISEAEWMTIAQNMISVPDNRADASLDLVDGLSRFYSGHNNYHPDNALVAGPDSSPYFGTSYSATDTAREVSGTPNYTQRRTMYLTTGQVMWDFAGNVEEYTSGVASGSGSQPAVVGHNAYDGDWFDWYSVDQRGTNPISPFPQDATTIHEPDLWAWTRGMGAVYSSAIDSGTYSYVRSGAWDDCTVEGIFELRLDHGTNETDNGDMGLRVTKTLN